MKTASDSLFKLIHSLTPVEKKNFILLYKQSPENKGSNISELFRAINLQREFEEEKLRQKFPQMNAHQFSVTKTILFEQIVHFLTVYSKPETNEETAKELLRKAEVLAKKNLIDESLKNLKKAKSLATEFEFHQLLLHIISFERKITAHSFKTNMINELENYWRNSKELLKKIENEEDYGFYHNLNNALFHIHGIIRSKEEEMAYDRIFKNSIMQDENKAFTSRSRWLYHVTWGNFFLLSDPSRNYKNAYSHNKKALLYFPKHFRLEYPNIYTGLLGNFLMACSYYEEWDDFKKYLSELEQFSIRLHLKSKQLVLNLGQVNENKLTYVLYNSKNPATREECLKTGAEVENFLNNYNKSIPDNRKVYFYIQLFELYYHLGDLKKSLFWINKIIHQSDTNFKSDVQCISRLVNLLIHSELNNTELLESQLRSTERFLKQRNKMLKIEKTVIKFIKHSLVKNPGTKELQKGLLDFKKNLIEISAIPEENFGLEIFDFICWANSKIENRPFREIYHQKLRRLKEEADDKNNTIKEAV